MPRLPNLLRQFAAHRSNFRSLFTCNTLYEACAYNSFTLSTPSSAKPIKKHHLFYICRMLANLSFKEKSNENIVEYSRLLPIWHAIISEPDFKIVGLRNDTTGEFQAVGVSKKNDRIEQVIPILVAADTNSAAKVLSTLLMHHAEEEKIKKPPTYLHLNLAPMYLYLNPNNPNASQLRDNCSLIKASPFITRDFQPKFDSPKGKPLNTRDEHTFAICPSTPS